IEEHAGKAKVLHEQWAREREGLEQLTTLKRELEGAEKLVAEAQKQGDMGRVAELKYGVITEIARQIEEENERLTQLGTENRMLRQVVEEADIAAVVASWTGIPVSKMMESERERLLRMEDSLNDRVVGQDDAIAAISSAVRRSRSGLKDPGRPIGNFFFVGPTGVGKTELAKALAEFLFDTEKAMIRIDMSEYMEQSKVSTLIGSARGYVDSERGGILTEAVRMRPFSVVLFDEAEKAHPEVFNLLLQVLDEGRLTDSQGREVNFANTIIIMTSNVGSRKILDLTGNVSGDELTDQVKLILRDHFKPEFLNRLDDICVFRALNKDAIALIVDIMLRKVHRMLAEQRLTMTVTDGAKGFLAEVGFEPEYGARPLKRAIQNYIQDPLATELLEERFVEGDTIVVEVNESGDALGFSKAEAKA
ncbi:MAG: AAA family ATPase, partial [Myxococcales bacterium]|nr:AAA family ATPase [Myxococcales bacterium]